MDDGAAAAAGEGVNGKGEAREVPRVERGAGGEEEALGAGERAWEEATPEACAPRRRALWEAPMASSPPRTP
jgi:hypothetical protein